MLSLSSFSDTERHRYPLSFVHLRERCDTREVQESFQAADGGESFYNIHTLYHSTAFPIPDTFILITW